MDDLNNQIMELIRVADRINAIAEAIANLIPEPEEKQFTLSDVRQVLAAKSTLGFTAEVKALLQKYGADRLSEIDPKYYASLVKEAEKIAT